ncbi:hypothetical protein NL676_027880 [Syzygium grande]|nr:hypothetical protein NL676_027880 [Syzygium grande]
MEKPSLPSAPKHERSSSIDNEAMTLTYKEFEKALKGALEVISTHNREEAEKIFLAVQLTQRLYLQGLKPVGSAVNLKLDSMANTDDDDDDEADNINEVKKP